MKGKARMDTSRLWKALACAFAVAMCLALAACGGNSGGSSAASSSAAESSPAADPSEKFIGDWKLAAAEMEGFTVTGDFSAGVLGENISMTLTLAGEGAGSMAFGDESADVAWKLTGDDAIAITPNSTDGDLEPMTATYDDGVLAMDMDDDEFNGTIYLSADGTMEGVRDISSANATDFTSESDLIGTWKLSGMNMMGVSMYGDANSLAEQVGDSDYTTVEISSDGTATIMGEDATWKVGSDGATIAIKDADIPLKALDGDILIDLGSLMGEAGSDVDLVMLYSK